VKYCGKRVAYFGEHTGICMRAPHDDDVEHLVEVVSIDAQKTDYSKGRHVPKVELHPHQEKAVNEMHNGCILVGDVGVGKTITSLAYALLKEAGKHIYVITTAKVRDDKSWMREAAKLAIHPDNLTIDSWNNIKNYINVKDAFFIFDEQRLVGTGTWVQSFYKIAKNNSWILLSATPGDNWLDYVPVFIANGFYKNVTEFREKHVIYARFSKFPKVDRYVDTGILQRRRKLLLVEMPVERHTTRHLHVVECDYDKERFEKVWKKRWNVYTDEPVKDAGELFRVARRVVAEHASRKEEVEKLMEKHPKLIVFYNYDYELEILRSLSNTPSGSEEPIESHPKTSISDEQPSTSSGSRKDCDPLKGTIWETGWDETAAFENARRNLTSDTVSGPLEKSSNSSSDRSPTTSGSGSRGSLSATTTSAIGLEESSGTESGLVGTSTTPTTSKSFAVAEWNGHKHEPIPDTDRWVYLVQYMSGSEGWNCIETDAMVFFSLTYSYKQFYQSQGRIDRMNTPFEDLNYYALMTKSIAEKAVWRSLQQKKDFNVRRFAA